MERAELSEAIKNRMLEKGLKQTELAAKLQMDYQSLTRALNHRRPIYAEELPRFAAALDVSMDTLVGITT